jgi:hypothetical protein
MATRITKANKSNIQIYQKYPSIERLVNFRSQYVFNSLKELLLILRFILLVLY